MNDAAKIDEFLKNSMTPLPSVSDRFQSTLQRRLASQRLGRTERWQLHAYLVASMLVSAAVMWWLAVPWSAIVPAVLVPAIFFLIFQRTLWPKSGN